MAVRANATGESLSSTTSLPTSTAFTICGWSKGTKRAGVFNYMVSLESASTSAASYMLLGWNSSGVFEISSSSGASSFSATPADETLFFWAITCGGTGASDFKGYWNYENGTTFNTASATGISFTTAFMALGNNSYNEWSNVSFCSAKVFGAALTEAELWAERAVMYPYRTTNVNRWTPLWDINDVRDYSGNLRHWTANGTLSTETNPTCIAVAPRYIASGAQTVTLTIGATLAPALPSGWAAGDLLVCLIAGRCNGSAITNTFSNSWTLINEQFLEIGTGATDLYLGTYYRYAEPGEAAPTVTPDADFLTSSTTGGVSAQIAAFRYVANTQAATSAKNTSAAATTWTPPAITTTKDVAMCLSAVATSDDNALNFNTANGWQLAMSGTSYDTTTGSDHAVGLAYYIQRSAGAVTMPVWNESLVGTDPWVGVSAAFGRKSSNVITGNRATYFWRKR